MSVNDTLSPELVMDRPFRAERPLPPLGGAAKRTFDVTVALLLLLALAPLMIAVIAIMATTDRGPLLFGHKRLGHGGRYFKCLKFRTMVTNSAEVLERVLATDPAAAQEWAETQKLRNDPRVTMIGAVFRKTSIDELPQLFNVLMGHMSLVGPRPIVDAEVARYGSDVRYYHAARPGITGLWQVSGRSDTGYQERVQFDRNYVERWSFARDIVILFRTAFVVLARKGSC